MALLSKKQALGVLALMLLDGEEKARIKRRNRRVWVRGWIARRQEINIYTETKRPLAAFPRATANPCPHASNIKADKRSE